MTASPVPRSVDAITAEWLTDALSSEHPGVEVTEVKVKEIIWGTSTKVLIEVSYADSPGPGGPGEYLCVKGEFDDHTADTMGQTTTQREAAFYRTVGKLLPVPLPHVWHAYGEDGAGGVLVLDDLSTQGVSFGDPVTPATVEEVRSGLSSLALLHGGSQGKSIPGDLVAFGSADFRLALGMLFSEPNWERTIAEVPGIPNELTDRERNLRAYDLMFEKDALADHLVLHGDAHIANTYRDPEGQVIFIDWPTVCLGHWAYDVAYYLAGSLTVADRRAHEKELLDHYRASLAASGGPDLEPAETWDDYGAHLVRGLIWATLPATSQPPERVEAMTERYVAAMIDHQTFARLGL